MTKRYNASTLGLKEFTIQCQQRKRKRRIAGHCAIRKRNAVKMTTFAPEALCFGALYPLSIRSFHASRWGNAFWDQLSIISLEKHTTIEEYCPMTLAFTLLFTLTLYHKLQRT